MKTLCLFLFSSFVCAAQQASIDDFRAVPPVHRLVPHHWQEPPPKVFKTPALAVRPASVAFSTTTPLPLPIRRITSAGWEASRISAEQFSAFKFYPYWFTSNRIAWLARTNAHFRTIARDSSGWWEQSWTTTFRSGSTISIPIPTGSWRLVSP